jgi:hypothetical protein
VVDSFEELIQTRFTDGCNALCWPRSLPGDFQEIITLLNCADGVNPLSAGMLHSLPLSPAGRVAAEAMLADESRLRALDLAPVLDCIRSYPRDDAPGSLPTHVYSFHADSAPVEADTYLCTYAGAPSEGLRNEDAVPRIAVPAHRKLLLEEYGGRDDEDFLEYLAESCHTLHYSPVEGAKPFSFGVHNLWRIALEYPGCPVPPCIHRAPENPPDGPPRLLLIS